MGKSSKIVVPAIEDLDVADGEAERVIKRPVTDLIGVTFRPVAALEVKITEVLTRMEYKDRPKLDTVADEFLELHYLEYFTGRKMVILGTINWCQAPDLAIAYDQVVFYTKAFLDQILGSVGYSYKTDVPDMRSIDHGSSEIGHDRLQLMLNGRFRIDGDVCVVEGAQCDIYQTEENPYSLRNRNDWLVRSSFVYTAMSLGQYPHEVDICKSPSNRNDPPEILYDTRDRTDGTVSQIQVSFVTDPNTHALMTGLTNTIDMDGYLRKEIPLDLSTPVARAGTFTSSQPWIEIRVRDGESGWTYNSKARTLKILDVLRSRHATWELRRASDELDRQKKLREQLEKTNLIPPIPVLEEPKGLYARIVQWLKST